MILLIEVYCQFCYGEVIVLVVYELVDVVLDCILELFSVYVLDLCFVFVIRVDVLRCEMEYQWIMDEIQVYDCDDSWLKLIQYLGCFVFDLDSVLGCFLCCYV